MQHGDLKSALIALAVLFCAADAPGAVAATLRAIDVQDDTLLPYRTAAMEIDNDTDGVIRAVALRWDQGGPTIVQPAAVAPRSEQTVTVALPAVSGQQTFRVRFLPSDDPAAMPIDAIDARIHWKTDLLTTELFAVPPNCRALADTPPTWPPELLRGIFLASIVGASALAGVLFLHRGAVRVVALVALVGVGAAIAATLHTQEVIATTIAAEGQVLAIGCRRSTSWSTDETAVAPLYLDKLQWQQDTAVVRPGWGITVNLAPGEVRFFRLTDSASSADDSREDGLFAQPNGGAVDQ
jgi:hypothetical protein